MKWGILGTGTIAKKVCGAGVSTRLAAGLLRAETMVYGERQLGT